MDKERAAQASARARELWLARRQREARALLEEAVDHDPVNPVYRVQLGMVLTEIGDYPVAHEAFMEAQRLLIGRLDLSPVMSGVLAHNWALLRYCVGDLDGAARLYQEAAEAFSRESLHDHHRQSLQNLAWVHVEAGRPELAPDLLDHARKLCKADDARIAQELVQAYYRITIGEDAGALDLLAPIAEDETTPLETKALISSLLAMQLLHYGQGQTAREAAVSAWLMAYDAAVDTRAAVFAQRVLNYVGKSLATGA